MQRSWPAHAAPPPEGRFTSPEPVSVPAQPARAANAPPADAIAQSIRSASDIAARATALASARSADPGRAQAFDDIFADLVIADLERRPGREQVEHIAACVTRAQPRGEAAKRLRTAIGKARQEAA